ncbi:DUF4197 domain-containing protein [Thiomonas sp.]|jgi:hypothetical protein|uniref:DUF4197 domain-containing protein n=1 Tax=Thiomonas sp. TaxID=2047785 RepID=UPI0026387772|nr:DUF4197 domain-containing protein [Thiomonas sp.]
MDRRERARRVWLLGALAAAGAWPAASAWSFDLGQLQKQLGGALPGGLPGGLAGSAAQGGGATPVGASPALGALSDSQVGQGLKDALGRGVDVAVSTLGRRDGFWGSPQWRIPLPPALEQASSLMRMAGLGAQADALQLAMNRAAEAAVPEARSLLVSAVRQMTITDAKNILTGGDHAATDYFRAKTQTQLQRSFLPIVHQQTRKVGLAQTYDRYASQAARFGLVKQDQASIDQYVTQQALDRLYQAIGDEEQSIRANPAAAGSALVRKVFGAVRGG